MDEAAILRVDHTFQQIDRANDLLRRVWLADMLWSWQWWTVLFCTVIPWVIWFRLRPEHGQGRFLCAGFFTMLTAGWMDSSGIALGLWHYHIEVVPTIPAFVPWDYAMYPTATMLLMQYGTALPSYVQAAIFAGTASFVVEPFFAFLGLYAPVRWTSFYSLPIHFVLYWMAYGIYTKLEYRSLKQNQ